MPKRQVAFRFGREHELRYIKELPRVGDHLRVGERLWIVTSVEEDAVGTSVICEPLRDVRVPDQELHHEWRRQGLVEGDGDVSPQAVPGSRLSMTEPMEDTQAWNPEDVDAIRRDVEEEDESGAPEKVAWPKTDDAHPLESAHELRESPYERSEDVTDSPGATPDLEERVQDKS